MSLRWAYFDTSILVKSYINEPGSSQARSLLRRYKCLTSDISRVEAMSAISNRLGLEQLTKRAFEAISARMVSDRRRWEIVLVSDAVLDRAEEVIRISPIKALDAIHIASALVFKADSRVPILFISADQRQLNAAAVCGLQVERGALAH